ncbi:imidazolonepropionase [Pseudomonas guariconensis]|uniref:imidazolonepropionase n=1 Tax=Pseudomonas TaxID=286 RepID=UPI00209682A6|nr:MULTISPECIES: imidazolonepropionase [Pseudomonas]MCO7517599.1 imidazolonepropionase [Pseudomonas putida]MCO7608115.1 imidazolonepropionase [Pseudomonas guariconensis]
MRTLWQHCHVATLAQGRYSIIEDAAIITSAGLVEWIGPRDDRPVVEADRTVDLGGAWVTPGLIDCHTHAVFGGNRSGEFEQRLQGVSYAEIAAQGGGIASTVRATRAASEDELLASARQRVQALMRDGVTTIEVKSGYGLDLANERKMLKVARRLGEELPLTVRSTCLAAHALPPEYAGRADDYIAHICDEMLPALAGEGLVDAVDAFCEHLAFSPAQVERVFIKARELGLPVKLHAEQLSSLHGSSLAARYQALSADHLEFMIEEDAIAMAAAGTVAVLLPGAFYFLRETQLPPMDALRRHGVKIALASDLNPGTSPALSLRLMLNMGCTLFRMTPEQALAGVTLHAAMALGLGDSHGSLEVGKVADFVAWQIERPADLAYWLGGDLPKRVVRLGHEISN